MKRFFSLFLIIAFILSVFSISLNFNTIFNNAFIKKIYLFRGADYKTAYNQYFTISFYRDDNPNDDFNYETFHFLESSDPDYVKELAYVYNIDYDTLEFGYDPDGSLNLLTETRLQRVIDCYGVLVPFVGPQFLQRLIISFGLKSQPSLDIFNSKTQGVLNSYLSVYDQIIDAGQHLDEYKRLLELRDADLYSILFDNPEAFFFQLSIALDGNQLASEYWLRFLEINAFSVVYSLYFTYGEGSDT